MGKVTTGFSMSLDGFIAGPNDDVQRVFAWMFSGQTEVKQSSGSEDLSLKTSEQSAEVFEQGAQAAGALVAGRHLFDVAGAWGGKHPLNVPVVVVTHRPAQEWIKPGSPFTFVTDGVESAVRKAQAIAGEKNVVVASANVLQQVVRLGLLEEIHIDLVPVLLGDGTRLFDHIGGPIDLEITEVVQAPDVTHLTYRVKK
jgi:dihydrofolate reductase